MITQNTEYKKIAQRIIRREMPQLKDVRIAYLESDTEKKTSHKTVFADCRKVAEQYSWCCRYDFMITVYLPNVADFTPEQLEILLRHELMHVGIDESNGGYYVIPHDIEEFYPIIKKYGMRWQEDAER